ncbi:MULTISPECIES: YabP/YqfC family sporulation protein [unclassified Ruminococcus]|uniref:YabP/YqfC family sporulation protein n=1 Tax=unclassified Ruminococcus TaxID=2608920 RepID=UPI00210CE773|nr:MULTISPECIES: YabP/YqfC family sporulation protein [unclassified Ruminococcus]MCQ4021900.1 sporulation protein [Ruminococcus sp. zg-924]MCQ4114345.1 sporulation protein [Ruminococcus sp. zg-921]
MAEKQGGGFIKNSLLSGAEKLKLSSVYVEMHGNTEVIVEGCKGILEYDRTIIRVSVGRAAISVKGRGLSIKCLSPGSVVISGAIKAIEYEG